MSVYKTGAWTLTLGGTVLFATLMYFAPEVILGTKPLDPSMMLSLIGVMLSYYGLIFSLYAALQVQNISSRYLFKTRYPELLKKLRRISKLVKEFRDEPSSELYSQQFISEAPSALRSAKRFNNDNVRKVAKEAELLLVKLKVGMPAACASNLPAGQIPNYWEFYSKISELVDEICEQIADLRASA
jgi:hypothetical protein